jgi:uncharacterized protein
LYDHGLVLMPIPKPQAGQTQDEYLQECIAFVLGEGTAQDEAQAYAICIGIWNEEREMSETMERRAFDVRGLEVDSEGARPRITGYAAVFDQLSDDLGGFRERIRPGAFAKTIGEADVRALWQHNPEMVLGRSKNGTLALREDDIGLHIDITAPETNWAHDALVSIERGDVDQMSFGFETVRDEWLSSSDHGVVRTLVEVKLFDVSPVTFPAYPQTSAQVRAHARAMQDEGQEEHDSAPGQEPHPEDGDEGARPEDRLDLMRRRLDLAERI